MLLTFPCASMHIIIIYPQYTFQVILSTDGISSFATFIYQNVTSLSVGQIFQTGFNSGDRRRFTNILQNSLREINTYRIDGKLE